MKTGKIWKKVISIVLAAGMAALSLATSAGAASVTDFTDVKSTDWYYSAVKYAVDAGLFGGTSATTFGPGTPMNRGMFVTALGRLAGVSKDYGNGKVNSFTDIKPGDYFYSYTLWAVDNNITGGAGKDADGNNVFNPKEAVTREQIATFLYRYFDKFGFKLIYQTSPFLSFPDSHTVSGYAVEPLKWATAYKVISGKSGNLAPGGNASRAEVAQMLLNFSKLEQYRDSGEQEPGKDPDTDPDPGEDPGKEPDVDPNPGEDPDQNPDGDNTNWWENHVPHEPLTGRSAVDENGGYYDYDLANEILKQLNELRVRKGLGELEYSPVLEKWAAIRAKECGISFSHTRPDGSICFTVGHDLHSENLLMDGAYSYNAHSVEENAESYVNLWYGSEGHRKNMTQRSDIVTGISVYVDANGGVYAAELFGEQSCAYYDRRF